MELHDPAEAPAPVEETGAEPTPQRRERSRLERLFRTLIIAGAMLLLAAAGGVLGYYFPGAFGLRPGTPDAANGPLVGGIAGLAADVIALVIAMVVRHRRRLSTRPLPQSIDWMELHDPAEDPYPSSIWPRPDWMELHDPAEASAPVEEASAPAPQWREPSRIERLFQPPLSGPKSSRFIGPRLPRTLEMITMLARADDMPLRAAAGGLLTADEYPGVLERQWQDWQEMFGGSGRSIPRPLIIAAMAAATLVLAGIGYVAGPLAAGVQSGAVAGAGGSMDSMAPWAGVACRPGTRRRPDLAPAFPQERGRGRGQERLQVGAGLREGPHHAGRVPGHRRPGGGGGHNRRPAQRGPAHEHLAQAGSFR